MARDSGNCRAFSGFLAGKAASHEVCFPSAFTGCKAAIRRLPALEPSRFNLVARAAPTLIAPARVPAVFQVLRRSSRSSATTASAIESPSGGSFIGRFYRAEVPDPRPAFRNLAGRFHRPAALVGFIFFASRHRLAVLWPLTATFRAAEDVLLPGIGLRRLQRVVRAYPLVGLAIDASDVSAVDIDIAASIAPFSVLKSRCLAVPLGSPDGSVSLHEVSAPLHQTFTVPARRMSHVGRCDAF